MCVGREGAVEGGILAVLDAGVEIDYFLWWLGGSGRQQGLAETGGRIVTERRAAVMRVVRNIVDGRK